MPSSRRWQRLAPCCRRDRGRGRAVRLFTQRPRGDRYSGRSKQHAALSASMSVLFIRVRPSPTTLQTLFIFASVANRCVSSALFAWRCRPSKRARPTHPCDVISNINHRSSATPPPLRSAASYYNSFIDCFPFQINKSRYLKFISRLIFSITRNAYILKMTIIIDRYIIF